MATLLTVMITPAAAERLKTIKRPHPPFEKAAAAQSAINNNYASVRHILAKNSSPTVAVFASRISPIRPPINSIFIRDHYCCYCYYHCCDAIVFAGAPRRMQTTSALQADADSFNMTRDPIRRPLGNMKALQ